MNTSEAVVSKPVAERRLKRNEVVRDLLVDGEIRIALPVDEDIHVTGWMNRVHLHQRGINADTLHGVQRGPPSAVRTDARYQTRLVPQLRQV